MRITPITMRMTPQNTDRKIATMRPINSNARPNRSPPFLDQQRRGGCSRSGRPARSLDHVRRRLADACLGPRPSDVLALGLEILANELPTSRGHEPLHLLFELNSPPN